jgi:hypothetical protein
MVLSLGGDMRYRKYVRGEETATDWRAAFWDILQKDPSGRSVI